MNYKDDIADFLRRIEREARENYDDLGSLPRVKVPRSVRLPRPGPGWNDVGYAITLDGTLAIMRADFDVRAAWRGVLRAGGSRKDLRLPTDARARILIFDGRNEVPGIELPLLYPFPYFDRLADGSWLVADNLAEHGKPNAALFSSDGALSRQLFLGEAIEQLQADPDGGFWIGYGDHGIFSSIHGVEHGGVVRFDSSGKAAWSLNDSNAALRHASCDHSYALNISGGARWAYTFSNFLLTRLDAERGPYSLRPKVTFADAFAIDGDLIMLTGGYWGRGRGHGYDRLVLLDKPGRWTPRRPRVVWIATVHRAINPKGHLWTARGDTLHCVRGKTWHRLSIGEADALIPYGPWRFAT